MTTAIGAYKHLKPYQVPDHYFGATWYGYYPVAGRSRDSSDLELSNFDAMLAIVGGETAEDDDGVTDVAIARASHWAVGWVETIYVHERRTDLCQLADDALQRLADYPVLDEDDFSRREWETATTYWQQLTIAERVELIHRFDYPGVSVFSARHGFIPSGDHGGIFETCRG